MSLECFQKACTEIARILQIPRAADDRKDVKELLRHYSSDQVAFRWLLVIDSADDMQVLIGTGSSNGVVGFLPKNEDGVTVFTSCRQEMAELLVGNLNTANGPARDHHDQQYWHNLLLFVCH